MSFIPNLRLQILTTKHREVFEVLTDLTGSDFTGFFTNYVDGLETLPKEEIFTLGGMDIKWNVNDVFITPDEGNFWGLKIK